MYRDRLEVLAATYEHLDTVMNSVLVVSLKFESRDRQLMQDTMFMGSNAVCVMCDLRWYCRLSW